MTEVVHTRGLGYVNYVIITQFVLKSICELAVRKETLVLGRLLSILGMLLPAIVMKM